MADQAAPSARVREIAESVFKHLESGSSKVAGVREFGDLSEYTQGRYFAIAEVCLGLAVDPDEIIVNQIIGYLKGKASLRLEEAANCDDPLSAEHEAELLESAALILEKSG